MRKTVFGATLVILAIATTRLGLSEDAKPAPPVEPKAICESVLGSFTENKFVDAIAVSRTAWLTPLGDSEWSRIASKIYLDFQTTKAARGKPIGWELVREQRVNETLRRYIYLVKYESGAVCWEFIFYRPHDAWRLWTYDYSDDLTPLWAASKAVKPQSPADVR